MAFVVRIDTFFTLQLARAICVDAADVIALMLAFIVRPDAITAPVVARLLVKHVAQWHFEMGVEVSGDLI